MELPDISFCFKCALSQPYKVNEWRRNKVGKAVKSKYISLVIFDRVNISYIYYNCIKKSHVIEWYPHFRMCNLIILKGLILNE